MSPRAVHVRPRPNVYALAVVSIVVLASLVASAAELKPRTIAAFERYQAEAERTISGDLADPTRFVRVLREPAKRQSVAEQLRRGEVVVERLRVPVTGREIDIPDGLVHHWVGAIFVPGVTLDAAVTLMQDYNRHSTFFRPNVVQSRVLEQDGDRYRVFLRFFFKKVISVTVNTDNTAEFTRHGTDRVSSTIRSTRIQEVENPGLPAERELPVGNDGGYLWRLNTYWRFAERDGGTYIECESVTLTRGIPTGFGWLIGPFVTSIPRETLDMTLQATKRVLRTPA